MFFSRVKFLCMCWRFYSVSVHLSVLPPWHVKDPGHSASGACPLRFCLSRHNARIKETSSHEIRQETLGYSHLTSLFRCGLILALKGQNWCSKADLHFRKRKTNKKAQAGIDSSNPPPPPNPRMRGKDITAMLATSIAPFVRWLYTRSLSISLVQMIVISQCLDRLRIMEEEHERQITKAHGED